MMIRVAPSSVSPSSSVDTPGQSDGCYYIKVHGVPPGVSPAQVILLFEHTARKVAEKDHVYEFEFSELCPTAELFRH